MIRKISIIILGLLLILSLSATRAVLAGEPPLVGQGQEETSKEFRKLLRINVQTRKTSNKSEGPYFSILIDNPYSANMTPEEIQNLQGRQWQTFDTPNGQILIIGGTIINMGEENWNNDATPTAPDAIPMAPLSIPPDGPPPEEPEEPTKPDEPEEPEPEPELEPEPEEDKLPTDVSK